MVIFIPDNPDLITEVKIGHLPSYWREVSAYPELKAIEYFWDKLVKGAFVVLDDYAWITCEPQKEVFDKFAIEKGFEILTLPTGQGLIIKP